MTEIILVLTVSLISIGLLIWVGVMSNKFFKYFKEIAQEIYNEQKKLIDVMSVNSHSNTYRQINGCVTNHQVIVYYR